MGDRKLFGELMETGGWAKFVKDQLGLVGLRKTGKLTALVRAVEKPELAVMNLRAVRMAPIRG